MCNDFIFSYYHEGERELHLKSGLFERIIKNAETAIEREEVVRKYSYLLDKIRK
tara:strand:+ start:7521 stop:7682 length:162 start_codon:yes stop_codon:yes gene_type:complete